MLAAKLTLAFHFPAEHARIYAAHKKGSSGPPAARTSSPPRSLQRDPLATLTGSALRIAAVNGQLPVDSSGHTLAYFENDADTALATAKSEEQVKKVSNIYRPFRLSLPLLPLASTSFNLSYPTPVT